MNKHPSVHLGLDLYLLHFLRFGSLEDHLMLKMDFTNNGIFLKLEQHFDEIPKQFNGQFQTFRRT